MGNGLYKATFLRPGPRMPGVLYEPLNKSDKSRVGIIAIHPEADYLDHTIGPNLSKRGYTVLCANTSDQTESLAMKIKDVKHAYEFMKALPGIEKVIIMGHSGGATLMSAYQAIAENGVKVFQGPEKVYRCPDYLDGLEPADGFISLDSNWGNGAMRLIGTDPSVMDESSGVKIDESLNLFNPANGFDPAGCMYDEAFLKRYFQAQHERNNRLIDFALERLAVIEAGKGLYADDEPMIIPGALCLRPNNKIFPQDLRFLCRTKDAHTLLHKDGVVTHEIVHTVRKATNFQSLTGSLCRGAVHTTVRKFLDSHAVRSLDEYHFDAAEIYGIDWTSSYNCTPGNVQSVTVPMVAAGMTASWEFAAVEVIYNNAASSDKTAVFVDGANHDFFTEKACERFEGEFGDTVDTLYNYLDEWISQRFV